MKKLICKIITLGCHWWQWYPEEAAYIRCRICGKYPKSMWETYMKLFRGKQSWGQHDLQKRRARCEQL